MDEEGGNEDGSGRLLARMRRSSITEEGEEE